MAKQSTKSKEAGKKSKVAPKTGPETGPEIGPEIGIDTGRKKRAPKSSHVSSPQAPATTLVPEKARAKDSVAPELVEAEIIEPAAPGYDPEELRAELESMRDVGVDEAELVSASILENEDDAELDGQPSLRPLRKKTNHPVLVNASPTSRALTATDPISIYLAELRKYPLLSKEQERELAVRYRETGDARAAELLVTSNLRFVVKVAAEYSRFGAKLIDLVQEGNVGLMHAVKEFNPYKGVRLITYAVWWIRGYIQEYLMRQYSLVRIGTTQNQRKLFYRLQKERDALGHEGQEPTVALLAGRLGVTEEEVETMSQRLAGRDVSLSVPVDPGGDSSASLLDFEASGGTPVDDAIGAQEELEVLKTNLEKIRGSLTEKELYILEKRVLADDPQTLQEIGEHYGVTREAVRQLEARLIAKIRKAVTSSLDAHSDTHPASDENE